ncbi:hypothetical protein AURDEDRAFT_170754 [Auricularia subglabra TFB-10046 SS5]|uniref:Uncharacterized protein n=1 Tax=Auricularia subglabra (strain TFB-10046 / SS5) TaxID=717982 RepID=J0WWH6_AURST|nr:hypothetical protein AURDEDRAFT_170754 [Auricularia subglabra TFB-10046 SS5]
MRLLAVLLAIPYVAASFNPPRHPQGTESAVQARQLTRERLMMRAEKLTMASLFGREDCSLPEPSTLACTCGPEYTLCGNGDLLGATVGSKLLTSQQIHCVATFRATWPIAGRVITRVPGTLWPLAAAVRARLSPLVTFRALMYRS